MSKNFEINLKKLRKKILKSEKFEDKKIQHVLSWLKKRQMFDKTKVSKVGLNQLKDWKLSRNEFVHKSGQFFSVTGVAIKNAYNREAKNWDQPILNQKHGGILAILTREKSGLVEFLLYARREPGDHNLKLCPSFSATQSNLNLAHGGKKTKLSSLIFSKKRRLICETDHYEEGARFFKKINKNTLIQIDKKDEKYIKDPNFIWLNLSQIKKLNLIKGIINPYVKTILFML